MTVKPRRSSVTFSQKDNNVNNDIDGNMFFEALVTATASGPPVVKQNKVLNVQS